MPVYTITAPNGKTYSIEGPAGATQAQVIAEVLRRDPAAGQPVAAPTVGGQVKEAFKGLIPGAVGLVEQAAVGASALLPDEYEPAVREKIAGVAGAAKAPFAAAPGYEQTIGRKLGEAGGSIIPLLAAAPFGLPGAAAAAALGVGAGAGEARVRAEQDKATEEERAAATALGVIPGALEVFAPIRIIKRLPDEVVGGGVQYVKRALLAGGEEAAQEAASGFAQNLIAKGIYKPEQELIEGLGEQAAYGGAVGAIAQGVLDLALGRRARGATGAPAATEDEQAEIEAQRALEARRLAQPVGAPQEITLDAEYGALVQARERLRQEEQTPEVKEQIKQITDALRKRDAELVAERQAQQAQTQREEELAAQSAFASQEPQQMEFGGMGEPMTLPDAVRAAGPEVEGWAKTDAGQAFVRRVMSLPDTEVEAVRESLPKQGMEARLQRKAFDALYPPTATATPQELEAAGQQRLPLRRTPAGQPTTSALEELDMFGTDVAPPTDEDIPEPTIRRKPELITFPEINEETVGKGTLNWVKTKKGQEFLKSISGLDPAEAQARRGEFVGKRQLVRGEIFDAIYPEPAAGVDVRPEQAPERPAAESGVGVPAPSGPDQTGAQGAAPSDGAGVADLSGAVGTEPVVEGAPAAAVAPTPSPFALDQLLRGAAPAEPTLETEPEVEAAPAEPAPAPARPSVFRVDTSLFPGAFAAPKRSMADFLGDEQGEVIYRGDAYRTAAPQAAPTAPIADPELRRIVSQVTRSLDLPDTGITVLDSVTQVDPSQRPGSRSGMLDSNGNIYLFRDGIQGGVEGQKTVFHELFHRGLRALLPPAEYYRVMAQLYNQSAQVRELADAWLADPQNKADVEAQKLNEAQQRAVAVDEVLASMAETRKLPGTIRQIGNWMAKLADRFGLKQLARTIRTMGMKPLEAFIDDALRAKGPSVAPQRRFSTANRGDQAEAIVKALGNEAVPDPTRIERAQAVYKDVRANPKEALRSTSDAVTNIVETFGTNMFSSDFQFQSQVRRAMVNAGMTQPKITDFLLRFSTASAVNSDSVATNALVAGAIKYDKQTGLPKVVKSDNNMIALAQSFEQIGKKIGKPVAVVERMWHTVTEAERLRSLMKFNNEVSAIVDRLRSEGRAAEAAEQEKRLKKLHRSPQEVAQAMALYDLVPELREPTRIWNTFKANIIDFMVDSGTMSREVAEDYMADAAYVPFYREEQIDAAKGPREYMTGLMTRKDPRFTGSVDKPVNDVFDNILRWAQYSVEKAVRNGQALKTVNALKELGWARPAAGLTPDQLRMGEIVTVFEDGVKVPYQSDIPGTLTMFRGLESISVPALKYFSKVADVLRQSIVLFPLFPVLQVPQDAFAAMFTSGLKPRYALKVPALAVKEFLKTLTKTSQTHTELKKYGAVGRRDVTSAVRRNDLEVAMGLKRSPGVLGKMTGALHHLSMASDSAVRQAVYEASLQQGLSKSEAIQKAYDLINFRYRGTSKLMSLAAQTIPFFNAYSAALYVTYRTLTRTGISPTSKAEAGKTFVQMFAVTSALALIYAMLIGDDEDYQNTPARERDRSLMIPGTGVGIPLRPDVFLLPKIIAEHTYQMMTEEGTSDPAKFRGAIADALANTLLSPTTVPQAVKPVAEILLNKNFFTMRPIVGPYEEQKIASLQFSENTSELSKALSAAMGPDVIAPAKLDHFIRGMFGSLGATALWGTNLIMDPVYGGERADLTWRDLSATFPGMSAVVRNTNETGLKADFYQLREATRKAHNTMLDMEKRMPQMLESYVEDPKVQAQLELADVVEQVNAELAKIRQWRTQINADTTLSGAEKQQYLQEVADYEQEVLRSAPIREWREQAL